MSEKWAEAERVRKLQSQKEEEVELPDLPVVPDDSSLEDKARVYEGLAMETLAKIAYSESSSDASRVAAANAILDRSRGKPIQEQRLSIDNISFKDMLDDMLLIRKGMYIEDHSVIDVEVIEEGDENDSEDHQ